MEHKKGFNLGLFVLRLGLALVLLWFGMSEVTNPAKWTSYVPDYVTRFLPLDDYYFVLINGIIEIALALMLLLGIGIKLSSLLVAIHLFIIVISVGYNEIGVRDFGLAMSALALFILSLQHEPSHLSKKQMSILRFIK